jgi:copper chaperone NosL
MKKISRILILMISLSLIIAYFTPIWEINLDAPQYPEGLGFEIWINRMTGDLQTVNGLNHYIGMKTIQPDTISELKLMPYLIGFLILSGILVAVFKKRKILIAWLVFYILLGIAGAIDFYMWEYDYGHNLNPEAAIKVPGMSYQPPLIGEKVLLNFTAYSYPSSGGMVLIAGAIFSILILFYEMKYNKSEVL